MNHIAEFVTAKLAAGLSPKTVDWYAWQVGRYTAYCADTAALPESPSTIEAFLVHRRRAGASHATVSACYRALRVYFGWLVKRGLSPENPLTLVDRPRVPRRRVRHVTLVEFHRVYDGIDGALWADHRDRAILVVMFYSGLRVGEVVALAVDDVDLLRNLVTVRHGKGGSDRIVPCAPMLCEPMTDYLTSRPAWKSSALWLSNDGAGGVRGPLTAEGVRVMLRRRCKRAGVRYLHPHLFRHGYAMTLLNAGMNMSAVSAALGHTSVAVTEQVYAAWLTDGLSREYAQALRRLTS